MRWLKSLVIVLGILIVGGMALMAYGFFKKTQNPDWRLTDLFRAAPAAAPAAPLAANPPAPTHAQPPAMTAFGEIALDLPSGCIIVGVDPDGDRTYLTIGPPGPCHRVMVVDIGAGKVLGTIRVKP